MITGIIYSVAFLVVILGTVMVLSAKYILFGLKVMWAKLNTQNDFGYLFIRNLSNSFNLPHIVDMRQNEYNYKIKGVEYTYIIQREHFEGFRFLGNPCAFVDNDNIATSIGIHFHKLDEQGDPLFHENGQPVITLEKPSFSLSPELVKAVLGAKALSKAIQDLFQKHKVQVYILGAIGIGIGLSLYLSYETKSVDIPMLAQNINEIKDICQNIGQEVIIDG